MTTVMIFGIVATLLGALWAQYEQGNPDYRTIWGISKGAANIINLLTTLLFPGGYLLILFAPGNSWLFNIGAVVVVHIVGVQILVGILSGLIGASAERRLMRQLESPPDREGSDED